MLNSKTSASSATLSFAAASILETSRSLGRMSDLAFRVPFLSPRICADVNRLGPRTFFTAPMRTWTAEWARTSASPRLDVDDLEDVSELGLKPIPLLVRPHVPVHRSHLWKTPQQRQVPVHLRIDEPVDLGVDVEVLEDRLGISLHVVQVLDEHVDALHARDYALSK